MVFARRRAARPAVGVDGADQHELPDAGGARAGQRLGQQRRVQRELPVVDADHVHQRLDAGGRGLHRRGHVGVPADDLGQRVFAETLAQRRLRAADDAVGPALRAQRCRHAVADGAGRAEQGHLAACGGGSRCAVLICHGMVLAE